MNRRKKWDAARYRTVSQTWEIGVFRYTRHQKKNHFDDFDVFDVFDDFDDFDVFDVFDDFDDFGDLVMHETLMTLREIVLKYPRKNDDMKKRNGWVYS